MEQIVHAAAVVFAERGYDQATTNAIAAQAGISPGSLYQFFTDKDDIARALATHYAAQLRAVADQTFDPADPADPAELDTRVASTLDQLIAFNLAHPGFKALFARTDMPRGLRDAVAPIHESIHHRVAALLTRLFPDRADAEIARIATVAIQIVRGMMPLITDASGADRDALARELHHALTGYLRQYLR